MPLDLSAALSKIPAADFARLPPDSPQAAVSLVGLGTEQQGEKNEGAQEKAAPAAVAPGIPPPRVGQPASGFIKGHSLEDVRRALAQYVHDYEAAWPSAAQLVTELHRQLRDGDGALFVEDGLLCLLTEELSIQLRSSKDPAAWTLINTHRRAQQCAAQPVGRLVPYKRNMLRTHLEVVQWWLAALFGLEYTSLHRMFYIAWSRLGPVERRPSQQYPAVYEATRAVQMEVHLVEALADLVPRLFEGRPIVNAPSPYAPGVLWSWWPGSMCPIQPDGATPFFPALLPSCALYDALLPLLQDDNGDWRSHLRAVLRAKPGGPLAVVMLLSSPKDEAHVDPYIVLHFDMNVKTEDSAQQANVYKSLREADPLRFARLLGTSVAVSAQVALWKFALDTACWHAPGALAITGTEQLVVLLDDLVLQFCTGDELALQGRRKFLAGPVADLGGATLLRLLAEIVGLGGLLSRLLDTAQRSEDNILDIYAPERQIAAAAGGLDRSNHCCFGPSMRTLLVHLCRVSGIDEADSAVLGAAAALEELQLTCANLRGRRRWRHDLWRPVCCLAHGNLSCTSIVADVFGSVWVCGASSLGGVRPVFWDFARLSFSMLCSCCRLQVSLKQLCTVATEDWVVPVDLARWLNISIVAAKAVLDMIRAEDFHIADADDEDEHRQQICFMKLLETAVSSVQCTEVNATVEQLKSRVVPSLAEADKRLQDACTFAEGWAKHLNLLEPFPAEPPPNLGVPRGAWQVQQVLMEGVRAAYGRALEEMMRRRPEKSITVDSSPLLLELPLLLYVLQLLNDPLVGPWQKRWLCRFTATLCRQLCEHLGALEVPHLEAPAPCPPAPRPARLAVRLAESHRLLCWSWRCEEQAVEEDATEGEEPETQAAETPTEGGPAKSKVLYQGKLFAATVGRGGGNLEAIYSRDLPNEEGWNPSAALLGWPCPVQGVSLEQAARMRAELGVQHVAALDVEAKRHLDVLLRAARIQAWMGWEACALYEVLGVVARRDAVVRPARSASRCASRASEGGQRVVKPEDVIVEDAGPGLVLSEEVCMEALSLQGKHIGLAASGGRRVRPCQVGGPDHEVVSARPADAYSRFPCAGCGRLLDLTEPPAAAGETAAAPVVPDFAHCEVCAEAGDRFDLCPECTSSRLPLCQEGHTMQELDESPYDRQPVCENCHKEITPLPPWEEPPEPWGAAKASAPHYFHCRVCRQQGLPPSDRCRACVSVRCPLGHAMSRIEVSKEEERQGEASQWQCRYCEKSGGCLLIAQCLVCQAGKCEVQYPNAAAVLADIGFSGGRRGCVGMASGIPVVSVTIGGLADIAGVKSGYRLVSMNGRNVGMPVHQNFVDAVGPCVLSFVGEVSEVLYDSGASVQRDLLLMWIGGALIVRRVAPGGPAARAGISRGFRVMTVNNKAVGELKWDGARSLELIIPGLTLYHFQFRKKGTEFIYHAGCGVQCSQGHFMDPQFPGFLTCALGHRMVKADVQCPSQTGLERRCARCAATLNPKDCADDWYLCCEECTGCRSRRSSRDLNAMAQPPHFAGEDAAESGAWTASERKLMSRRSSVTKQQLECARDEKLMSLAEKHCIMCWSCASEAAGAVRALPPYRHEGKVDCVRCSAAVLGKLLEDGQQDACPLDMPRSDGCDVLSTAPSTGSSTTTSFFHCQTCFANQGACYDLCRPCSRHHLSCTRKSHGLRLITASPYLASCRCDLCGDPLQGTTSVYHCLDCWLRKATRSDRCVRCAEQMVVKFTVDEEARFQVLTGEAPSIEGGLTWPPALAPEAHTSIAAGPEMDEGGPMRVGLAVRLHLCGFIYPLGTRLSVRTESSEEWREATLCSLLCSGKYEVCLDGAEEIIDFEPMLGNHVPSGVWRYNAEQQLTLFTGERGWLDVKVCATEPRGNRHIVEELTGTGDPWGVDLSSWNHSPLWLESKAWRLEQQRWDAQVLVRGSCFDVITGRPTDVMLLVWNVREVQESRAGAGAGADGSAGAAGGGMPGGGAGEGASAAGRDADGAGRVTPPEENKWPWLLDFALRSRERHRGLHTVRGALVLGEATSGKTALLRRLAVECVKAHGAEMVPIFVEATELVLPLDEHGPWSSELECGDFLDAYLRFKYREGSLPYLLLTQALHARRAVLLVDDLDLAPKELYEPLLVGLGRLVGAGHRLVVVAREDTLRRSGGDGRGGFGGAGGVLPAVPPELVVLRLCPPDASQQRWLAERRLQGDRASAFLDRMANFEASLASTVPMFELLLRHAELAPADFPEQTCRGDSPAWKITPRSTRTPSKLQLARFSRQGSKRAAAGSGQPNTAAGSRRGSIAGPSSRGNSAAGSLAPMTPQPSPTALGGRQPGTPLLTPSRRHHSSTLGSEVQEYNEDPCPELPWQMSSYLNMVTRAICSHTCPKVEEAVNDDDMLLVSKDEEEDGAENLRRLLHRLAFHLQHKEAETFHEHEVLEACHGAPELHEAWTAAYPTIQRQAFFLIRFSETRGSHGPIHLFRFAHPLLQHYYATCEVLRTWASPYCLIANVEEFVREARWQELMPFFADEIKEPISLRFSTLSEIEAKVLALLITKSSMVTHLNCDGAGLGQQRESLRHLVQALAVDGTLRHLDLAENGLGSEGAEQLCEVLARHPKLEELVLRGNHIGRVGATHVAGMLRQNRSLTKMDLAHNSISDEGVEALLPALSVNPTLRALSLQNNNIGPDSKLGLLRCLESTQAHRILDTRHNRRGLPERFLSPGAQQAASNATAEASPAKVPQPP